MTNGFMIFLNVIGIIIFAFLHYIAYRQFMKKPPNGWIALGIFTTVWICKFLVNIFNLIELQG
jgi:hypothetical protein